MMIRVSKSDRPLNMMSMQHVTHWGVPRKDVSQSSLGSVDSCLNFCLHFIWSRISWFQSGFPPEPSLFNSKVVLCTLLYG